MAAPGPPAQGMDLFRSTEVPRPLRAPQSRRLIFREGRGSCSDSAARRLRAAWVTPPSGVTRLTSPTEDVSEQGAEPRLPAPPNPRGPPASGALS